MNREKDKSGVWKGTRIRRLNPLGLVKEGLGLFC